MQKIRLFDIQKFSLNDGPGIRTTVFFKGCNLKCVWCHNPESLDFKKQLSFSKNKCTSCTKCIECNNKVHSFTKEHKINYGACEACGKCVDICSGNALKIYGYDKSINEIMDIILEDKIFYKDQGGVTFSGGEATMQSDNLITLAKKCKENNIHTCLETNGIINSKILEKLTEVIDLFLVDFKIHDPTTHLKYTGVSNQKLFQTLEILENNKSLVTLRCPIIPGINDTNEHLNFINQTSKKYKCIKNTEILNYHTIGEHKWEEVGKKLDYCKKANRST